MTDSNNSNIITTFIKSLQFKKHKKMSVIPMLAIQSSQLRLKFHTLMKDKSIHLKFNQDIIP